VTKTNEIKHPRGLVRQDWFVLKQNILKPGVGQIEG
jgi:hypothetical protein